MSGAESQLVPQGDVSRFELVPARSFAAAVGHDQEPTFRLREDGEPVLGLPPITHGIEWRSGMVARASDGRLFHVHAHEVTLLAHDTTCAPVSNGRWMATTKEVGESVALLRFDAQSLDHGGTETRTNLISLGALRVVDDRGTVIGIGSVNGGVAGFHRVGAHAECLSNCRLRAGRDMQGFVPPSSDFRVHEDLVVWETDGLPHHLRWRDE